VQTAKPAVFFDRDGLLNEAIVCNGRPYPPRDLSELLITPGAARAALKELQRGGFLLTSSQTIPMSRASKVNRADVDMISAHLAAILPPDAIEVCEHDDTEQCDCRKPKPGIILGAQLHGG
jgi:D-glycero-D-manno-heptose 1,7-bisphosphate phosphatase